ncbi:MAG: hypothetical protein ABIQ73_06995 [Acidimicrobiales bacterium]
MGSSVWIFSGPPAGAVGGDYGDDEQRGPQTASVGGVWPGTTRKVMRPRSTIAERAEAVLREHAGSQWDADVVAVAVRVRRDIDGCNPAFDNVGRKITDVDAGFDGCVCADALPALTAP